MNVIPIVFCFDNNLVDPACICISSLLQNACADTFYDIFILHSENIVLNRAPLDKMQSYYANFRITYRIVDKTFDRAFEIRGITTAAYYRLLIPDIIPEYETIIYSDVDVVFRSDLSAIYQNIDMQDYYLAGVNSLAHFQPDLIRYYNRLNLDPTGIIYSGNLIFNSKKLREDGKVRPLRWCAG